MYKRIEKAITYLRIDQVENFEGLDHHTLLGRVEGDQLEAIGSPREDLAADSIESFEGNGEQK